MVLSYRLIGSMEQGREGKKVRSESRREEGGVRRAEP
jgi:hypothetical protein